MLLFSYKTPFISFLLLVCIYTSHAQQYNFKNYSVRNGLASSVVNHIFQDSRGYTWFATQGGGISKFNGKEFINYTKADGLPSNEATFIAEDKKGNIWVATSLGASKFDGSSFRNYGGKDGLTDGFVYGIYADAFDKIWFATKENGVKIFNNGTFDSLTTKNGLATDTVYCISGDAKGNYWFGLWDGIAEFDGKKITGEDHFRWSKGKVFFSTLCDPQGNIWFGSASGNVFIISNDGSVKNFTLPDIVKDDFIGSIAQDKIGNTWFATNHGALKFHENTFTLFTENEGLSVNSVQTLLCDYEGNMWIGTLGGGADLLHSEAFVCYGLKEGLKSTNINFICLDPSGENRYYVGAGDGLYIFTPTGGSKFRKIDNVQSIKNSNISYLSVDARGLLWICAQDSVFVLQTKSGALRLFKAYSKIAGQNLVSPSSIVPDKVGNTWIGTFGSGLFMLSDKESKCFSTKNGFASNNILTVFIDHQSNVWIGTQDAGVIKFNGNGFEPFDINGMLKDKAVWSIAEDEQGNIFFGTGENGLYCFNGRQLLNYTTKQGLCSDYISGLRWDTSAKALWLGAQNGLNKIQFGAYQNITKIQTFDAAKGFNALGVNQNAIMAGDDGRVWLGSINGLWCYNPSNDLPANIPPKIQLSAVKLAYQKVNWKKFADSVDRYTGLPVGLQLSYNNNHLTFDMQALTTGDVSYRYKLEGLDKDWSPLTRNQEANYPNITPGKSYIFKAKAVNSSGIESSDTISFPFVINPAWWNTLWFRFLAGFVILGALVTVVVVRDRALKSQNLKLEKTVAERTAELVFQKEMVEEKNKIITLEKEKSETLLRHTEELNYALDVKNSKLEELDIEKNNFLEMVAHDLKNPLSAVRNFAEISTDPDIGQERRNQYLENIASASDRMYGLVNKLIDANFIETGKLNLHFSQVSLNELIRVVAAQNEPVAKKREIRLTIDLPPANVEIRTDKDRLVQIIENYLSNALKYCPAYAEVQISLLSNGKYHEISVADNGPGIHEEEQKLLFRPYGITSSKSLYGENKTGLGLAIVKKLADALNAETGYRPGKDKGCIFYIRFYEDGQRPIDHG